MNMKFFILFVFYVMRWSILGKLIGLYIGIRIGKKLKNGENGLYLPKLLKH